MEYLSSIRPVRQPNTLCFTVIIRSDSSSTYVLQPTLSGQMLRSATLRPLTPCTLRRSSTTPCLTMLLPSRGAMEQVWAKTGK